MRRYVAEHVGQVFSVSALCVHWPFDQRQGPTSATNNRIRHLNLFNRNLCTTQVEKREKNVNRTNKTIEKKMIKDD